MRSSPTHFSPSSAARRPRSPSAMSRPLSRPTPPPEEQSEAEPVPPEPAADQPPPAPVRELTVEVDGQSYAVRIIGGLDSADVSATAAPAERSTPVVRQGTVVSPMQGLLLKVNVKVGDRVALGDVVCVLEAMKVQNDITATRAGTITELYATEGTVVGPRAPLVQIGTCSHVREGAHRQPRGD